MKIAVYSDLHVEFGVFYPPADLQADVVVLAGDILCPGERVPRWVRRGSVFGDRPVIHVAGNHEYYGTEYHSQLRLMREQARRWDVHFLQQGTVVLGGVRFVGTTLWTDFDLFVADAPGPDQVHAEGQSAREVAMLEAGESLNDFRGTRWQEGRRRRLFKPVDARRLHLAEREWLRQVLAMPFDGPTVVVTHHAPHRGSLDPAYATDGLSPAFVNQLPEEFFGVPVLWVHGHTHTPFDYQVGTCRVVCNPRGYTSVGQEVDAFDLQGLLIEV